MLIELSASWESPGAFASLHSFLLGGMARRWSGYGLASARVLGFTFELYYSTRWA